jgi:hypothetical protein
MLRAQTHPNLLHVFRNTWRPEKMLTKVPTFAAYVAEAAPSKRLQRAQAKLAKAEAAKQGAQPAPPAAMEPVPEEDDDYVVL